MQRTVATTPQSCLRSSAAAAPCCHRVLPITQNRPASRPSSSRGTDAAADLHLRRGVCTQAAAKAAAAGRPSASVVSANTSPSTSSASQAVPQAVQVSVMASAVYAGVLILAMALAPRMKAVRQGMQSFWVFAPLAVTYLVLLALSWTPDTLSTLLPGSLSEGLKGGFNPQFIPRLDSISALFSQPITAASWVVHILAINLVLARSIYLDGLAIDIPTSHSVLVASVLGPLGLLLHWGTKLLLALVPGIDPTARERVLDSDNGGRITIMPYDR